MIQLSALTAKLDGSLDLYADVLLNPTFPESEFKREQGIQLANIQQEQSEPFGMALRVFPPLLYGEGHAYCHAVFRQRSNRHRRKSCTAKISRSSIPPGSGRTTPSW